nr:hypothetical transcript [Hymenolepis microstoma]
MDDINQCTKTDGCHYNEGKNECCPRLVSRIVKTEKIKTVIKNCHRTLPKRKEECYLGGIEAESRLKVNRNKEFKSSMMQTEELPEVKLNARIENAVQTDFSHFPDQTSCKIESVSESDIPKKNREEDLIAQDRAFAISSVPYCLSSITMDQEHSSEDRIEGEIFHDNYPSFGEVEGTFEYPVEMSVKDCSKADEPRLQYLYFQVQAPNEIVCVPASNKESCQQIDTSVVDVHENKESTKCEKKGLRMRRKYEKEKPCEYLAFLRKLRVPKRAVKFNDDDSADVLIFEGIKCFAPN